MALNVQPSPSRALRQALFPSRPQGHTELHWPPLRSLFSMAPWTRAFASFRNTRFYGAATALKDTKLYGATRAFWPVLYWMPTGVFLATQVVCVKKISGRSMQPTLNPDSSGASKDVGLFVHHPLEPVRHPGEFKRDDIVILRSPEDPNRMLIKRVVATEGDTVKTLPPYPDNEVTIPRGHVWVEGDNHFRTDDSNTFGPVSEGLIESKLIMLLWPPERFGPIPEPSDSLSSGKPLDRHMRDALWRQEMRHARVKKAPPPEEPEY